MIISAKISSLTDRRPPNWLYIALFATLLIVQSSCNGYVPSSCDPTCATCSNSSATGCLTCSGYRYYLAWNHSCVLNCPDGYYEDSSTHKCKPCHDSCCTCSNGSATGCLSCSGSNYFLESNHSCCSSCPSGYYANSTSHKCVKQTCHPSCATCSGPLATNCLTCSGSNYFLEYNHTCCSNCPDGYYEDSYTHKCKPCHDSCCTCTNGSATGCLSCSGSNYFLEYNHSCCSSCPSGYYANSTSHKCVKLTCHPSCATCSGPLATNCLTCSGSNYFLEYNHTCCPNCPDGYYEDSYTHKCKPCHDSCCTCTNGSATGCLSCSGSNYFLEYNHSCCSSCPSGYYANSTSHKCVKLTCHPSCATCSGPLATNCLTCSGSNYFLEYNHTCCPNCPDGYYEDSYTHKCKPCHDSCCTCTNGSANGCLSCSGSNYFLDYNNSCCSSCPSGYYANSTSHKCVKQTCHPSCATCSGPLATNCLTCSGSNYFLEYNHTCCSNCPDGYYEDSYTHKCKPCHDSCCTCTNGSANGCLSCSGSNYFLDYNNSCCSSCPSGYYANSTSHKCVKQTCHPSCATCSGPLATNCLTCSGYNYLLEYNHTCCSNCPDGYYEDSYTHKCKPCHDSCCTCTNGSANGCLSCSGYNYFLPSNHSCCSSCPYGYTANIATHTCVASGCHPTCRTCFGSGANQCITCADATPVLNGTSCNAQCEGKWIGNVFCCNECHASCDGCASSALNCIKCASGYARDGTGPCTKQRWTRLRE